jgi:hypothetical protein
MPRPMRSQPGIWVISSARPRAPVRMVTMRAAAEDMAARLADDWQREEPRQVPGGRAIVLEEARAELRARAGRTGRELDHGRAERAEPGRA